MSPQTYDLMQELRNDPEYSLTGPPMITLGGDYSYPFKDWPKIDFTKSLKIEGELKYGLELTGNSELKASAEAKAFSSPVGDLSVELNATTQPLKPLDWTPLTSQIKNFWSTIDNWYANPPPPGYNAVLGGSEHRAY